MGAWRVMHRPFSGLQHSWPRRNDRCCSGGGVIDAEASAEAVALAELLDMALVPSYGHNDVVPNSHRLYVGAPGGGHETAEAMHRRMSSWLWGRASISLRRYGTITSSIRKHALCRWTLKRRRSGVTTRSPWVSWETPKPCVQQLLQSLHQTYPAGRPNPEWGPPIETLAARRRDRLQAESTLSGDDDAAAGLSRAAQGPAARLYGDYRCRYNPRSGLRSPAL